MLMSHSTSALDKAMGIQPVIEYTLKNKYMTGWRYNQEAGLVFSNKIRHFTSLIMLFGVALWYEPINSLRWGDKEICWLVLPILGDGDYVSSNYGTTAIAEITSEVSVSSTSIPEGQSFALLTLPKFLRETYYG